MAEAHLMFGIERTVDCST